MKTPITASIDPMGIHAKYRQLLVACRPFLNKSNQVLLRRAFETMMVQHGNRVTNGSEPFFYHAVDVACIVSGEMGLGLNSVIAALLHDLDIGDKTLVNFLAEYKLKEVEIICRNLDRINHLPTDKLPDNAEHFSSLLLSLTDDVRAVLIRLADRLHHMRMIEKLSISGQSSIAVETSNLYAPLAHRLGLYRIKAELDELTLHFSDPVVYDSIAGNIEKALKESSGFIREFLDPVKAELSRLGLDYVMKNRTKSVSSVFSKMKKQKVDFDEVFDLFAIRIIIKTLPEN